MCCGYEGEKFSIPKRKNMDYCAHLDKERVIPNDDIHKHLPEPTGPTRAPNLLDLVDERVEPVPYQKGKGCDCDPVNVLPKTDLLGDCAPEFRNISSPR